MSFKIDAAVCSNMGRVRKNNEDNFYFNGDYLDEGRRNKGGLLKRTCQDDTQVYAVCDGMGGEERGEDASITAVRALAQYVRSERRVDGSQQLTAMLQNISDTIESNAQKESILSGTTIAMVTVHNDMLRTVHVGDSRVYSMENGKLTRMTVDHSEVQRLYAMGLIKAEEMETHAKRHVISQFLGMPRADGMVSPSISAREPLKTGKRYLICSDGLTDMVKDAEISQILSQTGNAEEAVKQLTIAALRNGGRDNVTTICLFIGNEKAAANGIISNFKQNLKLNLKLSVVGMALSGAMILFSLAKIIGLLP